jgi:hypothetical protein
MDRKSTEGAFTLSGASETMAEWLEDDKLLRLIAQKPLQPWTVYRWNVSEKALSREGVPLVKAESAQFSTDLDDLFPKVVKILPLLRDAGTGGVLWDTWVPLADNLEALGLGPGQGIGVEFNKTMDADSIRHALSFTPSLSGRVEQLSSRSIVFIPERNAEIGLTYTLTVSAETKDAGGLKMGSAYTLSFKGDKPFLEVLSLSILTGSTDSTDSTDLTGGGELIVIDKPQTGALYPVHIDDTSGGALRVTLRFSQSFTDAACLDAVDRITLDPFFPGVLFPISLRHVTWPFSDQIHLEWEGLMRGNTQTPHYYRLTLPGGRNGISSGEGSSMQEDRYFFFKAVE